MYYDSLLPERQRANWAVFESPAERPWSYGGVTAAHSNDCNCKCDSIEQCLKDGKSPLVWPNGLVAQHNCSKNIERLGAWEKVTLHASSIQAVTQRQSSAVRHVLSTPKHCHLIHEGYKLQLLLCSVLGLFSRSHQAGQADCKTAALLSSQ